MPSSSPTPARSPWWCGASPNGEAAIAAVAAASAPFDVVFIDWRMPGLDGIETGRSLREVAGQHAPALILVTAYGGDEILRLAEAEGFESILLKPITPST